ncbi:MAG: DUF433 domain-containing protein [Dehalococcoidia bacterium]|nr:DUF433 domain-containing protein [Dehalococcoidia bacterium]
MDGPLLAYTPDQVCRVTGLSRRQLAYWDATGFFRPRFARQTARFGRMYAFKDVVGLRAIAGLRHALPLQELRRIGQWLHERYEEPWSELTFFLAGRSVYFQEPTTAALRVAGTDQTVMPICLGEIERQTRAASAALRERDAAQLGRITRNRNLLRNAWVIDGTRVPVSAVRNFHEAGYGVDAILREYPSLTARDIEAALAFECPGREKAS